MHFSCKITNAVLTHLEENGEDLAPLYEISPLPLELLRDPSYWLSAPSMETFLENVLTLPLKEREVDLFEEIGHQSPKLLSWGVLDSVLRMMPRPQEILLKPARFLSYFLSPEPPIENLLATETSLAFDLPLRAEQYPLISRYLRAALESLPLYVGAELATCEWSDIHLQIHWKKNQSELFPSQTPAQISPHLLQNLVEGLQKNQKELEAKNRELMLRNEELVRVQKEIPGGTLTAVPSTEELFDLQATLSDPSYQVSQNLARLHDYMVRAQQLITLLLSQSKVTPGVKEVMKRVDWDYVKNQYPRTISESVEALRALQSQHRLQMKNKESLDV